MGVREKGGSGAKESLQGLRVTMCYELRGMNCKSL